MKGGEVRRFEVGQRVRVIRGLLKGKETVIVSGPMRGRRSSGEIVDNCYETDLPKTHPENRVPGAILEGSKLRPIYDGDQPATWEDCVWKPDPYHAKYKELWDAMKSGDPGRVAKVLYS